VVLMPPLSIHHSEIDRLMSVVRDAIVAVTSGDRT
jgi:adenosylmethionine-8-amino-7-oxononanoate aminotransferase